MNISRQTKTERYILRTNPVLYLPLYKLDGASILSKDAHGHVCIVTGTTWTSQGRSFDGNDYVDVSTIPEPAGVFSLVIWFKTSGAGNMTLFPYHVVTAVNYYGWGLTMSNGAVLLQTNDGLTAKNISSGGGYADGAWHYAVGVYDQVAPKIYVDGILKGTGAAQATAVVKFAGSYASVGVSRYAIASFERYFTGTLGEVIYYNGKALTPLEIQNIYLAIKWRYQ